MHIYIYIYTYTHTHIPSSHVLEASTILVAVPLGLGSLVDEACSVRSAVFLKAKVQEAVDI